MQNRKGSFDVFEQLIKVAPTSPKTTVSIPDISPNIVPSRPLGNEYLLQDRAERDAWFHTEVLPLLQSEFPDMDFKHGSTIRKLARMMAAIVGSAYTHSR